MNDSPNSNSPSSRPLFARLVAWVLVLFGRLAHSKKAWLWTFVALLVIVFGGIVPVGKIPLLRSLAYAMGYSPREAGKISFLKALFSWNEHAKIQRGELPNPDEIAVFGSSNPDEAILAGRRRPGELSADGMSADLRLLRYAANGQPISGSYKTVPGTKESDPTRRLKKDNAVANTESNRAAGTDLFNGEDASLIKPGKNDWNTSIKMLKKLAGQRISAVNPKIDWLDRTLNRAAMSDPQLEAIVKKLDKSRTLAYQVGDVRNIGDSQAKRDMYFAWLVGRVSRRTPNKVLKKTLASTCFDGAELPRSVFTAVGFSGVAINSDELEADMDRLQQSLDMDEQCINALDAASNAMPDYKDVVDAINEVYDNTTHETSFPATCSDAESENFPNALNRLGTLCSQMGSAYSQMKRDCASLSVTLHERQCIPPTNLSGYYNGFQQWCNKQKQACEGNLDCIARVNAQTSKQVFTDDDGHPWNGAELEGDVYHTFYDEGGAFDSGYFPDVDWGKSMNLDETMSE